MDQPTKDYQRQSKAYLAHLFPNISFRAIGLVLKHHEHSFTNAFLCLLEVEKTGEFPFETPGKVTIFIKQQRVKHDMTIRYVIRHCPFCLLVGTHAPFFYSISNVTLQREIDLYENVIKKKEEEVPGVEEQKRTAATTKGPPGLCARLFCCFSG